MQSRIDSGVYWQQCLSSLADNHDLFKFRCICFWKKQSRGESVAFALGLAITLASLGVAASFFSKAYQQVGQGLSLAASVVAVMGLNLLEEKKEETLTKQTLCVQQ